MLRTLRNGFLALTAISAAPLAAQTPIDLRSWTAESYAAVSGFPSGAWTVNATGTEVVQGANGQPTFFYAPSDLPSGVIEGEFRVSSGSGDDDYVGFAIGFRPGFSTNPAADYLLLDWKGGTQGFDFGAPSCTPGSTAYRGLALSRVRGIPTADELWGHVDLNTVPCSTPADAVTELARGLTLGATSWAANRAYRVRIDFTPSRVRIWIDDVLQFDVAGAFSIGRVGFYNFSQGEVTYRAFTQRCEASSTVYGSGYAGTLGIPTLTTSARPILGTSVDLLVSNAAGVPVPGLLLIGVERLVIPSGFGGDLQTLPWITSSFALPVSGAAVPFYVPLDPLLCGAVLYLQALHLDGGATYGIAFTPGLELAGGL
ncbi:MAG: hypothetical protein JNM84_25720 [Planctomycetes bacterium]|nr:hypothetical protein [Planctomycetota bacterium]